MNGALIKISDVTLVDHFLSSPSDNFKQCFRKRELGKKTIVKTNTGLVRRESERFVGNGRNGVSVVSIKKKVIISPTSV